MNIDTIRLEHETKIRLRDAFARIYKEEKRAREIIEKTLAASGVRIELMKDRDSVSEEAYQCFYCTDYAYISVIHCKVHNNHYCIYH